MFLPQEIIRRKRDGLRLSDDEIRWFATSIGDGSLSDAQVGAFAMAVYFQGMNAQERTALTCAMRDSGEVINWDALNFSAPIVVDKHSTGGLGDLTSFLLGPMLAACGAKVPMISGRGLGHTGGTLDKLEAIPGYAVMPSPDYFQQVVAEHGVAIIGQTGKLAPADKRLYAVRDVTATVESIDLICSSILSKKLAAGLDVLVMDVKVGSGAFMPDYASSKALAEAIVQVATDAGVKCTALLTDMNQPLAPSVGNAVEIEQSLAYLRGEKLDSRLFKVTMALAKEMLLGAGLAEDAEQAEQALLASIHSGSALAAFGQMVSDFGGPVDFVERSQEYLPKAAYIKPLKVEKAALLSAIDCRALGMAVVAMGGGRTHPDQTLDHSVGLSDIAELGQSLAVGDSLLTIHAKDSAQWQQVAELVLEAMTLSDVNAEYVLAPCIYQRISKDEL